jgi:hypothetical protein
MLTFLCGVAPALGGGAPPALGLGVVVVVVVVVVLLMGVVVAGAGAGTAVAVAAAVVVDAVVVVVVAAAAVCGVIIKLVQYPKVGCCFFIRLLHPSKSSKAACMVPLLINESISLLPRIHTLHHL